MSSFTKLSLIAAALMTSTAAAQAADLYEPPVVEVVPEVRTVAVGGWYLRGDIGYSKVHVRGVEYFQGTSFSGEFEEHDVDGTWMLSGGIGYQVTDYFRVDATLDHHFSAAFNGSSASGVACGDADGDPLTYDPDGVCNYDDDSNLAVTTIMANAYVDLGNYAGFTPYVGGGLGGALVHWDDLSNDETCTGTCTGVAGDSNHDGIGDWRFAYALHAGVSYDLNASLKLDAGYTFKHIDGGTMFDFDGASGSGPQGFDEGIKIHTVRAGLRWNLH